LALPRLVSRESLPLPGSSLHVHCTDVAGEWLVRADGDRLAVTREHAKGDAALRGRAEDLLLTLWGRPVPDGAVDTVGDPAAAEAWLTLGGM
jgi:predicted lipid carrier protein YhbT